MFYLEALELKKKKKNFEAKFQLKIIFASF